MLGSKIKESAISLRKRGYSLSEISRRLRISQSTASLWLKDIRLSMEAERRIHDLGVNGRKRAVETNRRRRDEEDMLISEKVTTYLESFRGRNVDPKIACALLYWCEGTKYDGNKSVSFINADPEMIRYFIRVFRESFLLDEKKFRALIHLHEYHDEERQLVFWSRITNIPINQFNKPHRKEHTGKSKKEGYPGCVSIRYSDSKIYKELMLIIKKLANI